MPNIVEGGVYLIPSKVTTFVILNYNEANKIVSGKLSYISRPSKIEQQAMDLLQNNISYFINDNNIFYMYHQIHMPLDKFISLDPIYKYSLSASELSDIMKEDIKLLAGNKNNYFKMQMFSDLVQAETQKEYDLTLIKYLKLLSI